MKPKPYILFILLLFPGHLKAQDINVFILYTMHDNANKGFAFLSLSDIYPVGTEDISPALPDIRFIPKDSLGVIDLKSVFRQRLLEGTKISEKEKIYLYDYAQDVLDSFPVKSLKSVACLNIYSSVEDEDIRPYYYMYGFAIDLKRMKVRDSNFAYTFACVGKQNPFVRGKLKPMLWKEISPEDFPVKDSIPAKSYTSVKFYEYQADNFRYFIKDFYEGNAASMYDNSERRLVVIHTKTKKIICDKTFQNGESSTNAPLSTKQYPEQWAGMLFKNKPSVAFGFQYESFSCPGILFLGKKLSEVYISCDNRH